MGTGGVRLAAALTAALSAVVADVSESEPAGLHPATLKARTDTLNRTGKVFIVITPKIGGILGMEK
jgi:hypothetical protein